MEDRYFQDIGWRVRIVNFHSTLEKIKPLLERRLRDSMFAGWHGDLYIDSGEQNASLKIESGIVEITSGSLGEHSIQGGADIA